MWKELFLVIFSFITHRVYNFYFRNDKFESPLFALSLSFSHFDLKYLKNTNDIFRYVKKWKSKFVLLFFHCFQTIKQNKNTKHDSLYLQTSFFFVYFFPSAYFIFKWIEKHEIRKLLFIFFKFFCLFLQSYIILYFDN